jgi:hypothetical protein
MVSVEKEKIEDLNVEETPEDVVALDSTAVSAAFIIGTTISGGDPDVGKKFAKFVKKKIKKR